MERNIFNCNIIKTKN